MEIKQENRRTSNRNKDDGKGKFDGILFCSDIDGTIRGNGEVPPANREAIRYFQENGGHFTFCTGRFPDYGKGLDGVVTPNAPVIALNGTVIFDRSTGQFLYRQPLEESDFAVIVSIMQDYPCLKRVMVHTVRDSFVLQRRDGGLVCSHEGAPDRPEAPVRSGEDFQRYVGDEPIFKGVFIVNAEDSDRMLDTITARCPGHSISRSWINGIELQHRDADKGTSARRLAARLGSRLLICAGDYENDIPMLRTADIGYAVANASERVKAVADRITVSCEEGAIARIIAELDA